MLNPTVKSPEKTDYVYYPTPVTDEASPPITILPPPSVEAIIANVEKNQQETVFGTQSQVMLPEPTIRLSDDNMYAILAALQQTLHDAAMETTAARMGVNTAVSMQRVTTFDEAVAATETAKQKYQDSLQDLDSKNNLLSDAQVMLDAMAMRLDMAQRQFDEKKNTLAQREAELALAPNDPKVQAKYEAALSEFNSASQGLTVAQSNYDSALQQFDAAGAAAIEAAQAAVAAQAEVTRCLDDLTRLSTDSRLGTVLPTTVAEIETALKVLMDCMIRLSEILSKCNEDRLKDGLRLYREKQAVLQTECEKKSKAFQKAVAEAEAQQKKMRLIGKILGWAITGISVAAAVATGGTAAALIPVAITLAMAITDEVLESQGEATLTSRAMDPMMRELVGGFAKLVKELKPSISEEDAQLIATILAAVAMVVATIAVSKGAGAAVDKAASLSPALKGALARLSAMSLGSGGSSATAATYSAYMRMGTTVAQVSNSAIQAGMGISVGLQMQSAKNSEADYKEIDAILEILKKVIQEVVDNYAGASRNSTEMLKYLSEWIAQNKQAGAAVLRNVAA